MILGALRDMTFRKAKSSKNYTPPIQNARFWPSDMHESDQENYIFSYFFKPSIKLAFGDRFLKILASIGGSISGTFSPPNRFGSDVNSEATKPMPGH